MRPRVPPLLRELFREASADHLGRQAAALSYFAIFSLPGLLVLVITVASVVWGRTAVEDSLFGQFDGLIGAEGAGSIRQMIADAGKPKGASFLSQGVGIGGLFLGATGFFLQLQSALNSIWGVRAGVKKQKGIVFAVLKRILSFGMVLGLGLLVMVSLAFHALLGALGDQMAGAIAPGVTRTLLGAVELVVTTVLIAGIFAAVFKFLPDLRIEWREVAIGALVTAVLFMLGKFAIGFYLGRSNPGAAYGAAGPLVLVLVWIYYSTLVILFGAEFTQVYARLHGPHRAERTERARAKAAKPHQDRPPRAAPGAAAAKRS